MTLPRILIVQTGTAGALAERHGDYPAWFQRALGDAADASVLLRADQGERLDSEVLFRSRARGVIVTGSPLSVLAPAPWMEPLGEELHRLGRKGVPVLGVCFGHQLLCRAAGVEIVKNPRGRELGTVRVQLTAEGRKDPLFAWAGDDDRPLVQATHADAVYPVPMGATLLASNENTPVQAVRFSDAVASIQFHPELWPQALSDLILDGADVARAEGLDPTALEQGVQETRSADLLKAFAEQVGRA
jgi:GMP synthase (glutamine-hydrolysing)